MSDRKPVAIQPVVMLDDGTPRFQSNRICQYLLDAGPFNMNDVAMFPGISQEEREQFAQLIGYSVGGFEELHYASPKIVAKANRASKKLRSPT